MHYCVGNFHRRLQAASPRTLCLSETDARTKCKMYGLMVNARPMDRLTLAVGLDT